MEVNGAKQLSGSNRSSTYLPLCSAEERTSHRFATTLGWVNDDRIVIFGWSIPLRWAQWWLNWNFRLAAPDLFWLWMLLHNNVHTDTKTKMRAHTHREVIPGDACKVRNKSSKVLLSYSVMVTPCWKCKDWPSSTISSTCESNKHTICLAGTTAFLSLKH